MPDPLDLLADAEARAHKQRVSISTTYVILFEDVEDTVQKEVQPEYTKSKCYTLLEEVHGVDLIHGRYAFGRLSDNKTPDVTWNDPVLRDEVIRLLGES